MKFRLGDISKRGFAIVYFIFWEGGVKMDCQKFAAMLDRYADLSEDQIKELEEHTMDCEQCRTELEFFRSIISAAADLPTIEPPAELLSRINDELDKQNTHIGVRAFDRIARNVRINIRRYATAAACLLVGVIVGLNSGMIIDSLEGRDSGGVIREQVSKTNGTPESETPATAEAEAAVSATLAPQSPTAVPAERATEHKTQAAVSTPESGADVAAPVKTSKPVSEDKPAWIAPAETPAVSTTAPVITAAPVSSEPAKDAEPKTDESNKYVMSTEYHMPDEYAYNGEKDVPEEEITEQPGVESYSLATEETEYSYANEAAESRSVKSNPGQLIIDVSSVDRVVSIMNELGVANSGVAYVASADTFYALLDRLDAAGIEYSYVLNDSGDNISFKIILI